MNKREMAKAVVAKGIRRKNAEAAINSFISIIKDALAAGDKVQLLDFGTFYVKEHAAHIGRNPQTGEVVKIPAYNAPSFKAGKGLKDKVNEER